MCGAFDDVVGRGQFCDVLKTMQDNRDMVEHAIYGWYECAGG